MQWKVLVLAAVLTVSAAGPAVEVDTLKRAGARNNVFEEMFLGILEDFRETMLTGSDDLPVLDPLEIEHLHLELDDLGIPGHITVGDLIAKHLSTFVIDELSVTNTNLLLQRYQIIIDGHIPVIEVDTAEYDLNVAVLGTNIFGNGSAKLKIIEPRIHAEIEIGINLLGLSLTLRDAKVSFYLKGFEPEISGLFGTEEVDDFVNIFLSNLIPEMVEFFHDDITEILSNLVLEYGGEILDNIDILGRSGLRHDLAVVAMLPALQANVLGPARALNAV